MLMCLVKVTMDLIELFKRLKILVPSFYSVILEPPVIVSACVYWLFSSEAV